MDNAFYVRLGQRACGANEHMRQKLKARHKRRVVVTDNDTDVLSAIASVLHTFCREKLEIHTLFIFLS